MKYANNSTVAMKEIDYLNSFLLKENSKLTFMLALTVIFVKICVLIALVYVRIYGNDTYFYINLLDKNCLTVKPEERKRKIHFL